MEWSDLCTQVLRFVVIVSDSWVYCMHGREGNTDIS